MNDNRGRPTKELEAMKEIFLANCTQVSAAMDDNELTARQIAEVEHAAISVLTYVIHAKRKADSHYIQEYLERLAEEASK